MIWKRILVLAHSYKYGGRCVAGREVLPAVQGYQPGPWLRPISDRDAGELTLSETRLRGGRQVQVLDVVDVPVRVPTLDPIQSDNWLLAPQVSWRAAHDLGRLPPLTWFVEQPHDLWLETRSPSDRIARATLLQHPPRQSLYLIQPRHFRLRVGTDSAGKPRRQATFEYASERYELSVTDPIIWDTYHCRVPGPGEQPIEFPLPCGDELLLCISLTREFHDYHYKVVATILEEAVMNTEPKHLFTIGHSNHELPVFLGLLEQHHIQAIADVRSSPYSRYAPQYNREALRDALKSRGLHYVFLGQELGARRSEPECYENGKARYPLIVRSPLFQQGLERLQRGLASYRIALLCAEKDPLYCHRLLLVCRQLRNHGLLIQHIREDGRLESQADAEERLLSELDLPPGDLFLSRSEMIELAYDRRDEKIAYVETDDSEIAPAERTG